MIDSCDEYNMKINKNKTKVLIRSKKAVLSNMITIENEKLETVRYHYMFRGSKMTYDGKSETDTKSRTGETGLECRKRTLKIPRTEKVKNSDEWGGPSKSLLTN